MQRGSNRRNIDIARTAEITEEMIAREAQDIEQGNLAQVSVTLGDTVDAGDVIGTLMEGADCVFEVRRDGLSIDPALYLGGT